MSEPIQPPDVSPGDVLAFARHVAKVIRSVREDQVRTGSTTEAKAARDMACADDLVRLAENELLFSGPPLN